MATKKKTSKIIPLAGYISSNFIPSSITASQIEAIPPYPDPGVRFEGYAKKLSSVGYRLLKQQNYNNPNSFAWTTSNALLTLSADNIEGFDIYISSISFTYYSDTNCRITLVEYPSLKNIAVMPIGAGQGGSTTIMFSSPYLLKDISYGVQPNVAITGRLAINVTGWYEQI